MWTRKAQGTITSVLDEARVDLPLEEATYNFAKYSPILIFLNRLRFDRIMVMSLWLHSLQSTHVAVVKDKRIKIKPFVLFVFHLDGECKFIKNKRL